MSPTDQVVFFPSQAIPVATKSVGCYIPKISVQSCPFEGIYPV